MDLDAWWEDEMHLVVDKQDLNELDWQQLPYQSVADMIEAGRGFERMALRARERGVAVHPMTQILEEEIGRRGIASNHDAGMIPQFVLRVGYVDPYPDPVSPRRPVNWFLRT